MGFMIRFYLLLYMFKCFHNRKEEEEGVCGELGEMQGLRPLPGVAE